ncbi:MAG: N-(5'-phosphoribosyl)anthranilate isomerase [Candidatus Argoarchaeum ethanivorans]|uniref:N-(5'-phosphoribosyl)anthranilate isomerase n=1 Tax=Candidatus Argoarchaeum ethanivorans TaxID=2608793 RepID=A0A812A1Z0_9EURY|nr:MAG: N-(5'-phosphoribosyl)anthranilate isomerase [Candidatus Argoarchaeum ethanivorans]
MTVRVKICGNKNISELKLAIDAGCDAVGFITEVPVNTPRNITLATASDLIKKVPPFIDSVLVIMPDTAEKVIEMAYTAHPKVIQLHNFTPYELLEQIQHLRAQGINIIQTVAIPEQAINQINNFHQHIKNLSRYVDAVLLDTQTSKRSGGTGKTHDWQTSRDITEKSPLPVILAGGLNHQNVEDAVRIVKPFAVDTASGVETEGAKDEYKVRMFIYRAKCRLEESVKNV